MALFNRFPFSNMHELNLDWILRVWNTLRGGSSNQVLAKRSNADFDFTWVSGGGGGGTDDYEDLNNKPQINGNTLTGNKTSAQLGINIPAPAAATPKMDGTADVGSSAKYAREDHRHPPDTTRTTAVTVGNMISAALNALTPADIGAAPAVQEETVTASGDVVKQLDPGTIYHFTGALNSLTIALAAPDAGDLAQYHFDFSSGSTPPTITVSGSTVYWPGGSFAPEASKHYEVDILNDYGVFLEW